MKVNVINIKLILFVFILCVSNFAVAKGEFYLGLDYEHRWMKGSNSKKAFMRDVLEARYHGFACYLWERINHILAMEFGYEQGFSQSKEHTFIADEDFIGDKQNAGDVSIIKLRVNSFYVDCNAVLNINDYVEGVAIFGIGAFKTRIRGSMRLATGGEVDLFPSGSHNPVVRIGLGVRYYLNNKYGLRTSVRWDSSSLARVKLKDEDGTGFRIKPFKSSVILALGVFVSI